MTVNGVRKEKFTNVKNKQSLKGHGNKLETNLSNKCDVVSQAASKNFAAACSESDGICVKDSKVETFNNQTLHDESKWRPRKNSLTKLRTDNENVNTKSGLFNPLNVSSMRQVETENVGFWWHLIFAGLVILAIATRLRNIDDPDHVCWDETHFGKFGSWYINRTFFFDVHPPLGKMLIGLFGVITGYDGSFPFLKPGDKFQDISYVGMRVCCALLGSCLVPFVFITVWDLSKSLQAATLAASLVLFDNGLLTLSRYILLDPILMFFISATVMATFKLISLKDRAFCGWWWFWLVTLGVCLACSVSVKFVGLFVFVFVGLVTAWDLWNIMGDLSRPFTYTIVHFISRAICLLVLPAVLYISFFYMHLCLLNKSGTGDGFFSSAFQSQLKGNSLYNATMPQDVAYGAIVTLKNHRTGGGYLHSHWHLYPEGVGARQQQVTTYTHKDDNNKWMVKPFDVNLGSENRSDFLQIVTHGDLIRLEHIPTKRNLHSHKEPAPVSKRHFQVTGYGEDGNGDANDIWRIEIIGGKDGETVKAITSQIRLIHLLSGCALQSSNKQLPKWAYEQMEVTCSPNLRDKSNVWNIEDNSFPKLSNVSVAVYAPTFWQKFVESHAVMLQGNSGLKPKEGELNSKPWQWPINYRGQFFSGNPHRIYLLGNPVIWWGNLLFILIFTCLALFHCAKRQRGYKHSENMEVVWNRTVASGTWLLIGWCVHYAPFWVMGRVLYFHHYFPALIFSCMLSGIVLDFLVNALKHLVPTGLSQSVHHWAVGGILSIIVYSFYIYSPLTYGMHGPFSHEPNSTLHHLKLLDSWEF